MAMALVTQNSKHNVAMERQDIVQPISFSDKKLPKF
jgi:hypothetical protein